MRHLSPTIGQLHFVGIGGIGMSGIAEILHNLGYKIQGSDVIDNYNVARLRALGIPVTIGQAAKNVTDADLVIISSAIKPDNPELVAARAARLPIVRRAEMLAELMRLKWSVAVAGTHGKTTTTSMVACLLEAAELDPTVVNGGVINAYGTNARLGQGDWIVVESDESDGSFNKLPATVAIVTNIDPEHMEHYGTFDRVREAYHRFVEGIPFYGFAVLCADHTEVQNLAAQVIDKRIVTYGFSPQADIRGINITSQPGGCSFDIAVTDYETGNTLEWNNLFLPMFGHHNVQNALAAVAVAHMLQISEDVIRQGLAKFAGVKRRFTVTGITNGVTIVDDYGHHPVEIAAVLKAARAAVEPSHGRVIALVQPHRYSRLENLFESFCTCFNDADTVIVADVYAAGEQPIAGIDKQNLAEGIIARGHRDVHLLESPATLPALVASLTQPGDLVICLGAGDITKWAATLPGQLAGLVMKAS